MRQKAVVMLVSAHRAYFAGRIGVLDTFFVSFLCNINLGVLMPCLLGVPLLLVGFVSAAVVGILNIWVRAVIKWLLVFGYGSFFLLFAVTSLLLHAASAQAAPPDADAVIVLGAGLRGDKPMLVLRQRMDTAIEYLQKNPGTVAILSGGKGEGRAYPSGGMARYFKEKGVHASRYIKEDCIHQHAGDFFVFRAILRERFGPDASWRSSPRIFMCTARGV
jgi:uncharacterized SAM-binding protein YcdF (DUF218 family)